MQLNEIQDDRNQISLRRWRVMEVTTQDGTCTRHAWGHDATNNQGRASSAIIEFSLDTMTAKTRSGTLYKLVGLPGNSRIGQSAWVKWCRDNGVVAELDVTGEYLDINKVSTLGFKKITRSLNQ
ncbi:hypothetical protein MIZ01_1399 [Sideroxyarcus emersonii]|uniref:Uncharacterized protein n=1 Tax=Sideroxyarcus emersonii TaxID=2764705 RepID=A0AAN2BZ02_9PROT|nr:hypothetical protein [Sideroxyarcus emersonii]BCK87608.1 hypothetical protein MIZ01_1399 [Sideroxyarcus emersonii]